MPGVFRVLFEQVAAVLKELTVVQRITMTLLGVVIFISLFALTVWGARPDYVMLYSGLTQQDAGEITQRLTERNIKYQLNSDGTAVMVPANVVRQLRVELATEGLPKGTGFGYELFDQFKLGTTEFTQKVNYQRALETELGRTISSLDNIRSARVHIVMPEESIFVEDTSGASASLVLDVVGDNSLSTDQINGLVHLVASSVKNLSPKNITVVDTNGNVLYSFGEEDGISAGLTMKQVEIQKKYERMIQSRIESMLSRVFGSNSSVVRVNVVMNFDKMETNSEVYIPAESPIVRSERAVEEGFRGSNAAPPADVNVPGGAQGTNQNSNYTKLDETRNYEVSKRVEHFVKSPGSIIKMSVAVILDRTVPDEQRTNLINAISSAAGIDEERGDQLTFTSVPFDKTTLEQDKTEMEEMQRNQMILNIAKNVGLGVLLLITVLYARRTLKRISAVSASGGTWGVNVQAGHSREMPTVPLEEGREMTPEEQKKVAMKNTLTEMIRHDPDVFAKMLRRWLTED